MTPNVATCPNHTSPAEWISTYQRSPFAVLSMQPHKPERSLMDVLRPMQGITVSSYGPVKAIRTGLLGQFRYTSGLGSKGGDAGPSIPPF